MSPQAQLDKLWAKYQDQARKYLDGPPLYLKDGKPIPATVTHILRLATADGEQTLSVGLLVNAEYAPIADFILALF